MSQTPQSLMELFGRYLRRQMAAQAEGLGLADPDGQAVPHDAVPVQPVNPRLAWEDALTVFRMPQTDSSHEATIVAAPPDWPQLVAALEPAVAVPLCMGNFPQMVRNLQPFLSAGDLSALCCQAESGNEKKRPLSVSSALLQWARTRDGYPDIFVAAGVLRLARCFTDAKELLNSSAATPGNRHWLRANEEAALAWSRGHGAEALALWQSQEPRVPVVFNRGMASLFLGLFSEARSALEQAISHLPESSAWHHLGQLYLALIAARS